MIDVAIVNYLANDLNIFKNTSTAGNVSFEPKIKVPAVIKPDDIKISDIDGDGKPDLVVSSYASHTVSVYKNVSDNTGIKFAEKIDNTYWQPKAIAMADMDADGLPDMVIALPSADSKIVIRKNTTINGIITFASAVDLPYDAGY